MPTRSSSRGHWILFFLAILLVIGGLAAVFLFLTGGGERLEIRTSLNPAGNTLLIDGINHGMCPVGNLLRPASENPSRLATTYYHRHSPVGLVLERFNWFPGPENTFWADARLPASLVGVLAGTVASIATPYDALVTLWSEPPVGVLDLGVGTLASYARPWQIMDFYESNPAIKEMSLPMPPATEKFTYLEEALQRGAAVRIFEGPERNTLAEKGPEQFYGVLVVDTARSHPDYPSTDRLTREAMQIFFSKVTRDGVVCFHISSRKYELSPVIAAVANDLGFACRVGTDPGPVRGGPKGGPWDSFYFSSRWVIVARDKASLERLTVPVNIAPGPQPFWSSPAPDGRFLWTDDMHNLARARR
jgi:hypothetical protein